MSNISPKVLIVIVNWNGCSDTLECLESLFKISYRNFNVLLVDNNSNDDSMRKILKWADSSSIKTEVCGYGVNGLIKNECVFDISKQLFFIKNDDNYGFAGGNNIALKLGLDFFKPEYFLLLNNDTVVTPDFLDVLVNGAESDVGVGIVGPKLCYYYERKNIIQSVGGRINLWTGDYSMLGDGEEDVGQYGHNMEVGYIRGACLLIKKKVVEEIGLLEERYFAYFEETDWCKKARNLGYSILYVAGTKVWHKHMSSTKKISWFLLYHMTRNLFWFQRKYANGFQLVCFYSIYFLIKLPLRLIRTLKDADRLILFKKYFEGIKDGLYG